MRPEALMNEVTYVLLQLLTLHLLCSMACAAQRCCSAHVSVFFLTAHAALVAHRLGGVDDAVMGLCITVLSDLQ